MDLTEIKGALAKPKSFVCPKCLNGFHSKQHCQACGGTGSGQSTVELPTELLAGLVAEVEKVTKQRDIFLKALHGVLSDMDRFGGSVEIESTTTMDINLSFYLAAALDGKPIPEHMQGELAASDLWSTPAAGGGG